MIFPICQNTFHIEAKNSLSKEHGQPCTFEFPSRVNLSCPSLYCIARTLGKYSRHSIGLAGATRLTRSDFRLNLLLLKGQRSVRIV